VQTSLGKLPLWPRVFLLCKNGREFSRAHRHLYGEGINTKQDTQQADIVRVLGQRAERAKRAEGGGQDRWPVGRGQPQKG